MRVYLFTLRLNTDYTSFFLVAPNNVLFFFCRLFIKMLISSIKNQSTEQKEHGEHLPTPP